MLQFYKIDGRYVNLSANECIKVKIQQHSYQTEALKQDYQNEIIMSIKYYTLPINTKKLMANEAHNSCTLNQSISHYIHLVNTSNFGECAFDESFGSAIWLVDFDNLKSTNRLKDFIQESLYTSLNEHEKRLDAIRVNVNIKQEELLETELSNRIKKRIDIRIKGRVKKTNEAFSYVEYFYIGPLSY